MGEPDHGRHEDVGPLQEVDGEGDVCRPHGRGRDAVPTRELDTVADEVEIDLRSQERVVDRLRDLLIRQVRHGRLVHGARIAA
jgi:hypothetical protein